MPNRPLVKMSDQNSPDVERRDWTHLGGRSAMGRSTLTIVCPFCRSTVTAYLWSIAGKGKRCTCGAIFSAYGSAYQWKDTTAP